MKISAGHESRANANTPFSVHTDGVQYGQKRPKNKLLDPLTVERATYNEIRSKGAVSPGIDPRTGKPKQSREGALLGNRLSDGNSLYVYLSTLLQPSLGRL